jgi:hypothetical protein
MLAALNTQAEVVENGFCSAHNLDIAQLKQSIAS